MLKGQRREVRKVRQERIPEVRVAGILVRGGRLLLVQHQKGPESYWVLPGGKLEWGEAVGACLRREIREETGLLAEPDRLLYVADLLMEGRHVVDLFFLAQVEEGTTRLGQDPEARQGLPTLVAFRWVTPAEFGSLAFRPPLLQARLLRDWGHGFPEGASYLGEIGVHPPD